MRIIPDVIKGLYRYEVKPIGYTQRNENDQPKGVYKKNLILIDHSDEKKTLFLHHKRYDSYTIKNTVTLFVEKDKYFQAHQTEKDKNNLIALIQGQELKDLDISDMTTREISQRIKKTKEKNKLSKLKKLI